jgi:CheY-like chemotaxis protein
MVGSASELCPGLSRLDGSGRVWVLDRDEPESTQARNPGILVVDDDLAVRTVLSIFLREHGFEVWLASDGFKALKAYSRRRPQIDLVLLDVRIPGMDGPHTLTALQAINPDVRCWFMTGELGRYVDRDLLAQGAERILYKPFRMAEVAQTIQRMFGGSGPFLPAPAEAYRG